jgi:hypothetical protein
MSKNNVSTFKITKNSISEIKQTEMITKVIENAMLKIVAKNKLTIRPKLDYCLIVGYLSNLLFEDMMTHNSNDVRNYIATEIVPKLMSQFNLNKNEMKEFAQRFRNAVNH